ncbi:MAG: type II toxin-antitoxin system prevent-host-death family antitoxin [Thermodesulfovibrionales bacterium]
MIKVNIHEAKTHLSRYLEEVEQGETIVVCRRNLPIAEIRPLAPHKKIKRSIGLGKKNFKVPASFFEELPEETRALFNGAEV